jgi:hypothetical protein
MHDEDSPLRPFNPLKVFEQHHREVHSGAKRWGLWAYDPHSHQLVLTRPGAPHDYGEEYDYYLPVRECHTQAGRLHWIAQVEEKSWVSSEILGDLVRALNDLIPLRSTDDDVAQWTGAAPASTDTSKMSIAIFTDRNTVPKKVGEAELTFSGGPLDGLTLRGFGIWRHPRGGYNVTVPSRPNGANNYWFVVNSSDDPSHLVRLKDEIIDAFIAVTRAQRN